MWIEGRSNTLGSKELQDSRFYYMQADYELRELEQDKKLESESITGALKDNDTGETWVTNSNRPYELTAHYYKLTHKPDTVSALLKAQLPRSTDGGNIANWEVTHKGHGLFLITADYAECDIDGEHGFFTDISAQVRFDPRNFHPITIVSLTVDCNGLERYSDCDENGEPLPDDEEYLRAYDPTEEISEEIRQALISGGRYDN